MRVQFEFTLEDCVDASKRFLGRSKASAWQWQGVAYSALFTWLLVFVVVTYFYGRPEAAAAIGLVIAALSGIRKCKTQNVPVSWSDTIILADEAPNKGLQRTRRCVAFIASCVDEPLKRNVRHLSFVYDWLSSEQ